MYTLVMNELRLIEGGILPKEKCARRFISSTVTNTRLMGAMGLYIHWEVLGSTETSDLHQFFYLDSEEFGLESYTGIWHNDYTEIDAVAHTMMSCLGGRNTQLTEKEARVLLCSFAGFNRAHGLQLPEKTSEYRQLIEEAPAMDDQERNVLWNKMCGDIVSDYQLINYFLMRYFGGDFSAAAYLAADGVDTDQFPGLPPLTLCKNTIDERDGVYLCESLIENDGKYHIAVSEISVSARKVTGFARRSGFDITPQEAAMQLVRPEFITVYEIMDSPQGIENEELEMEFNTMVTIHENGKLFLVFKDNNDHVNKRVYRLGEDVFGLYYITDFGQFIAAAYSAPEIEDLERRLMRTSMGSYLFPTAKYEFKEPVLYAFIQSDYFDFEEFLRDIRSE